MLLVLDSNIYIFALGRTLNPPCEKILKELGKSGSAHTVRIPRTIVGEVRAHLTPEAFKEFIFLINELTQIDEDSLVSFQLGAKYEAMGLKLADAFIAAYAEWVGAEVLVTQNRDFLIRRIDLPFRIARAEDILPEL